MRFWEFDAHRHTSTQSLTSWVLSHSSRTHTHSRNMHTRTLPRNLPTYPLTHLLSWCFLTTLCTGCCSICRAERDNGLDAWCSCRVVVLMGLECSSWYVFAGVEGCVGWFGRGREKKTKDETKGTSRRLREVLTEV